MRRSTTQFLTIASALAFAGCGFTPRAAEPTGGGTGAGNSTGITITGAGASSGTGNSGGGNNNGNSTIDSNCGAKNKDAARLPPDILIVLDASGSMNDDVNNMMCTNGCGATSKWAQMTPAINQVVAATENDVNWGLKFFASDNACAVNANANVTVGTGRAAMIAAAIMGRTDAAGNVTNGSRTPTRAGVMQGAAYLNGLQDDNPKYIVLATDGLPNCPMSGNTGNDDTAGAVAAVQAAATSGVPVFVVGIATGGTTADATLSMMATAGGRPRAGSPSYYSVSSGAELQSVLTMLVGMASTCTFQVGPPPTTDGTTSTGFIDVFGDGTKIPRDTTHANGWDYVDATMNAIQVYGPTCTAIENGSIQRVVVTFKCIQG